MDGVDGLVRALKGVVTLKLKSPRAAACGCLELIFGVSLFREANLVPTQNLPLGIEPSMGHKPFRGKGSDDSELFTKNRTQ